MANVRLSSGRLRMAETGENYTVALTHLLGVVNLGPLPATWQITG